MHISDYFNENILIDTHAHIVADEFAADRDEVISRSIGSNVNLVFDIGVNIVSSQKAIENAKNYKKALKAFVGIDPEVFEPGSHYFIGLDKDDKWLNEQKEMLSRLIEQNPILVFGIGETGMDYYWLDQLRVKNYDFQDFEIQDLDKSRELQEKLFRMHLELAEKFKLPLSIHSRGAEKECLNIVKEYSTVGIFHSYTGNYEVAKDILEMGWGLGVNGIVTFKNARELRDMYKKILGDIPQAPQPEYFYKRGIFFETDAPFLSPEGKRGLRNEPANVKDIYDQFVHLMQNA